LSTQENRTVVRRWVEEVINEKKLDVVDGVLSADLQSPFGDREDYKTLIAYLHRTFPDFNQAIDELIAEGDRVVMRWTSRDTHRR
jgi:predicted ester cyclase